MSREIRQAESVHISYKDYFDPNTQANSQQWDPASFYQLDFYDNHKFRQVFSGTINDSMLSKLTWYVRSEHIEVVGLYDQNSGWSQSRMKVRLYNGNVINDENPIPIVEKTIDIGSGSEKTWQGEVHCTFDFDDGFFIKHASGQQYTWEIENLNPEKIVLFFSNTGFRQGSTLHPMTDIKYTKSGYWGGWLGGYAAFSSETQQAQYRSVYPYNVFSNHIPNVGYNYRWVFRTVEGSVGGRQIIQWNAGVKTTNSPAYSTEFSASQNHFVDPVANTSPGNYPEVLSRLNGATFHDSDPGSGSFTGKNYFWKTGIKFKNANGYMLIQIPHSLSQDIRVGLTVHADTQSSNQPEPSITGLGAMNPCTSGSSTSEFNDYDGLYSDDSYGKYGHCWRTNGSTETAATPHGNWEDHFYTDGTVQHIGKIKYDIGPLTPSIHFVADVEEVVDYRTGGAVVDFKTVAEELGSFLDTTLGKIELGEAYGFNKLPYTYSNYTFTLDNKTRITSDGVKSFIEEYKAYINLMSQRTTRGTTTDWLILDAIDVDDYIEDMTYDKFKAESDKVDAELTSTPLFSYTQLDTTVDVNDISYQTSVSRHNENTTQRLISRSIGRDTARTTGYYRYRVEGYYRYTTRGQGRYETSFRYEGIRPGGCRGGWGPFRFHYYCTRRFPSFYRAIYRYETRAEGSYRYRAEGNYRYEYRFEYRFISRYSGTVDTEIFENTSHRKEVAYWTWAIAGKEGDVDTWKLTNDVTNVDLGTGTDADFDPMTVTQTKETSSAGSAETKYWNSEFYEGTWATVFPNYPLPHAWDNHTLYYTRANILQRNQAGDLVRASMTGSIGASAPSPGGTSPVTTNHVTSIKWW